MKAGIPPLVIGNWKMNPQSVSLSIKLTAHLKKLLQKVENVDVVIAPPSVHLDAVARTRNTNKGFVLGAQNAHHEKLGAHTGEVSLPMLTDMGVAYIIIGHSERRRDGETDAMVNQKLIATLKSGLTGVVCVGETKRDQGAHYLSLIETQIRTALASISKNKLGSVVIAYEPIWAIGTGINATSGDVHEMKLFILKVISDLYGRNIAQKVRILYGGSVNGKNAEELFKEGMIDGFLVGGASLHPEEFLQIIKATKSK